MRNQREHAALNILVVAPAGQRERHTGEYNSSALFPRQRRPLDPSDPKPLPMDGSESMVGATGQARRDKCKYLGLDGHGPAD